MTLKTHTHPPKSGGKPKSIVFLLHGYGANGADLLGLAPEWADELPDTVFLSPDAPFPCEMGPFGFQWFSLMDRSPALMLEGAERASPILNNYIDQMLQQYDLAGDKAALVGFSQGTMMSLYVGPRRKDKLAGILGYSGALLGAETLGDPAIQKMPIHLIHGDLDTVVPLDSYYAAHQTLQANGFPVTGSVTQGLPHGIDGQGIADGGEFLSRILSSD